MKKIVTEVYFCLHILKLGQDRQNILAEKRKGGGLSLNVQSKGQFYAKFLGSFSLDFNGQRLWLKGSPQKKSMQLLMALLKAGAEGATRQQLLEVVWKEGGDPQKEKSNLNQHLYYLRQLIHESHFPEGKYIIVQKPRYYFTEDYEIHSDTEQLDQILEEIRNAEAAGEDTLELLRQFCRGYTGEFLPMLNGEEWVVEKSAYYQKQYFSCLSRLCGRLKEMGGYQEMLELCTVASQIHPYDEWQAVQIDCLVAMNRYKDALKVYEDAAEFFYEDLGVSSLNRTIARYRNTEGRLHYLSSALAGIRKGLNEEERLWGAYCCSYPSFVDVYRIVVRMQERTGIGSLLMVCTLNIAGSGENTETWMERFRQFMAGSIRNGDVYTRYSPNQFLVLLMQAEEKDVENIEERLKNGWKMIDQAGKTKLVLAVQTSGESR